MNAALAAGLLLLAPAIRAAEGSGASSVGPRAPSPGTATLREKEAILDLIALALDAESSIARLEPRYRALRKSGASDTDKLAALELLSESRASQDRLFREAMDRTSALYRVRPARESLTIAPPDDPGLAYTTGLPAVWSPRAADSGPGVSIVIKIRGSDGQDHYGGAYMDPTEADGMPGTLAQTFEDGRTMILKDTFRTALKDGNPGFLAAVLYHESVHFEQLSRSGRGGSGPPRGWGSREEDEREAYARHAAAIRAFGLKPKQRAGIRTSLATYEAVVASGQLTWTNINPRQQSILKRHYADQVNIEEETTALKAKIAAALTAAAERTRLALEEQARLELEEARRREREEEEKWLQLESMAGRCGYKLVYQNYSGKWLGFSDRHDSLHFRGPYVQLRMNDVAVALMISRSCRDVEQEIWREPGPVCNPGAFASFHAVASQPDIGAKLDYLFGSRSARSKCISETFARAAEIQDVRAFQKYMAKYRKRLKKEREEYAERWHTTEPTPRKERDYVPPPREPERRSPDHDEVWRRINPILR